MQISYEPQSKFFDPFIFKSPHIADPLCFCSWVKECKETEAGHEYRGTENITFTGKTCQRWDATSPHEPNWRPTDEPLEGKQ